MSIPGQRHYRPNKQSGLNSQPVPRSLLGGPVKKTDGRNSSGRITIRHRGGQQKRQLRIIDWKRNKIDMPAKVVSIDYDPNRTAHLAHLIYPDGTHSYILSPVELKVNDQVIAGDSAPPKPGNCLPMKKIPIGTPVHNLELRPGKGAQLVRSAGVNAFIQSKEDDHVVVKLPSGELRRFAANLKATIGQVSNPAHKSIKLGKAGRKRHMGFRPTVRGVAQHPGSHPHGGGEGRSGVGMKYPKSPWGKHALGKRTRKRKKYSDKQIIKRRNQK